MFQDTFDKAQNNYQLVSAMLILGRIHALFGRTEQARKAFEYVVAHGNKLLAVTMAYQELEVLSEA